MWLLIPDHGSLSFIRPFVMLRSFTLVHDILIKCRSTLKASNGHNFVNAVPLARVQCLCSCKLCWLNRVYGFGPATFSSPCASGLKSCQGSFADNISLELSQRGKNMKDQPTCGSTGVEILLQTTQLDPKLF